MVVYNYDANSVLVEPLNNIKSKYFTMTFLKILNILTVSENAPKIYILYNKIFGEFKDALKQKKLTYQLVPCFQHRCKKSERAIQTFKNHFIAGLSSMNPLLPISEWESLIPHAVKL